MNTHDASPPSAFDRALAEQQAASAIGFDWPDISGVLDKTAEELAELREAVAAADIAHAQRELGDLLFTAVNLARFLLADPENCLHEAADRFAERMAQVRILAENEGICLASCTLDALETLWTRAKHLTAQ
jgi:uncharacterized protein YabN with tetrapyrrole methylase and pyrophosphatase domain